LVKRGDYFLQIAYNVIHISLDQEIASRSFEEERAWMMFSLAKAGFFSLDECAVFTLFYL